MKNRFNTVKRSAWAVPKKGFNKFRFFLCLDVLHYNIFFHIFRLHFEPEILVSRLVASVLSSKERAGPSSGKVSRMRRLGNDFSSATSSSFISAQHAVPFRMGVEGSCGTESAVFTSPVDGVMVAAVAVVAVGATTGTARVDGVIAAGAGAEGAVWITTSFSISIDMVAVGADFSSLEPVLLSVNSIVASTSFAALSAIESELLFAIVVTIVAAVDKDCEVGVLKETLRVAGEVKEAFRLGMAFLRGRVLKSSITRPPTEARATREFG